MNESPELRDRVTMLPDGLLHAELPPQLGAVVAMNVIGHFTPAERHVVCDLLARRLLLAGRAVVNLQPPAEPVQVPQARFSDLRIGRRRYEGRGRAGPRPWWALRTSGEVSGPWRSWYARRIFPARVSSRSRRWGSPGAADLYGWAAFELAHMLHGDPAEAGTEPLLHLIVPSVEVALHPGKAEVRSIGDTWTRKVCALLADAATPDAEAAMALPALPDAEKLIAVGGPAQRQAVARDVADIHAGLVGKAVLSRVVPLPPGGVPDFTASYLTGRRANTPARSFLLKLGGWQAAGFSPETVVEVDPSGRVSTQPLAGTRALGRIRRRTSVCAVSSSRMRRRCTSTRFPYGSPASRWSRSAGQDR
nr:chorismate-binding protein [Microbispora cellulosiformans]